LVFVLVMFARMLMAVTPIEIPVPVGTASWAPGSSPGPVVDDAALASAAEVPRGGSAGSVARFSDLPLPQLTREDARAAFVEAGIPDEQIEAFLALASCESHLYPGETGDSGASLGILQVNRGHFARAGEDLEQWMNPVVNARTALWLYRARGSYAGTGGWGTCAALNGLN
jgi:hypothetical protein